MTAVPVPLASRMRWLQARHGFPPRLFVQRGSPGAGICTPQNPCKVQKGPLQDYHPLRWVLSLHIALEEGRQQLSTPGCPPWPLRGSSSLALQAVPVGITYTVSSTPCGITRSTSSQNVIMLFTLPLPRRTPALQAQHVTQDG